MRSKRILWRVFSSKLPFLFLRTEAQMSFSATLRATSSSETCDGGRHGILMHWIAENIS